MADKVVLSIVVDDQGTPAIKNFSNATTQAFRRVSQDATEAHKSTTGFFTSFESRLSTAAAVSLAFGAVSAGINLIKDALSFTIDNIVSFDKALHEVASISAEVRNNYDQVRTAIISTSGALGTTTEIAKGLYEVYSAGIVQQEGFAAALRLTEESAKLAIAGLTSTETATRILTQSLNAYSQDTTKATQFSDILFKSVELGQYRFEELTHAIGPVEPVARSLGVSFSDVNAALATLSQAGYSATLGATALRGIFINLIENMDHFRLVGINVQEVIGTEGLEGLLKRLAQATGKNAEALKLLIPDTRAYAAVLSLMSQDQEKVHKNFLDMANAAGATDVAFTTNQQSIANMWKTFLNETERVVQIIGVELVPAAGGLITTLNALVSVIKTGFDTGYIQTFFSLLTVHFKAVGIAAGIAADAVEFGPAEAYRRLVAIINEDLTPALTGTVINIEKSNVTYDLLGEAVKRASAEMQKGTAGFTGFAQSSEAAAFATKKHTTELELFSALAVLAGGSITELEAKVYKHATTVQTLKGALAQLNLVYDKLHVTGMSSEVFSQEIRMFEDAVVAAEKYRLELQKLGIDTTTAASLADSYGKGIGDLAAKLGISKDKLSDMVFGFKAANEQITEHSVKLKEAGVDTVDLAAKVVGLTDKFTVEKNELSALNDAYKKITGVSLAEFTAKSVAAGLALKEMAASGQVDRDFLVNSLNRIIEGFTKLGVAAPKTLTDLSIEFSNLPSKILGVQSDVDKLGISLEKTDRNKLDGLVDAFFRVKNSGDATAESLMIAAGNIQSRYQRAGIGVRDDFIGVFDEMQAAAQKAASRMTISLGDAMAQLGLKLQETVMTDVAETFQLIEKVTAEGQTNFGQLATKAKSAMDAIVASGQQVPPEYQQIFNQLVSSAQSAGQSIGDELTKGFEKPKTALERLNEQLKDFVSQQKFGSDLATLEEQKRKTQQEMAQRNVAAPGMLDAQKQSIEALKIIQDKIDSLSKQSPTVGGSSSSSSSSSSGSSLPPVYTPNEQSITIGSNQSVQTPVGFTPAGFGGTDLSKAAEEFAHQLQMPIPDLNTTKFSPNQIGTRFANGVMYAQPNQWAQLEGGEAVLNRQQAQSYRQERVQYNAGASYGGGGAMESSGFVFVPGQGHVPNFKMSAATGRLDRLMGPNAQRELQRTIQPIITQSINRKVYTKAIQNNTSITRRGVPVVGG